MPNIIETHTAMVLRLKKPGADILKSLTPDKCDFLHIGPCLAGEAAELYESIIEEDEIHRVVEEAGDFEFYLVSELDRWGLKPTTLCTKALLMPRQHAFQLMKLGGDYWDVTKRIIIYGKDPDHDDPKHGGFTLRRVARDTLVMIQQNLNSIYHQLGIKREEVLQKNYEKLADKDKGRYASGSFSDKESQDRRDEQPR